MNQAWECICKCDISVSKTSTSVGQVAIRDARLGSRVMKNTTHGALSKRKENPIPGTILRDAVVVSPHGHLRSRAILMRCLKRSRRMQKRNA